MVSGYTFDIGAITLHYQHWQTLSVDVFFENRITVEPLVGYEGWETFREYSQEFIRHGNFREFSFFLKNEKIILIFLYS